MRKWGPVEWKFFPPQKWGRVEWEPVEWRHEHELKRVEFRSLSWWPGVGGVPHVYSFSSPRLLGSLPPHWEAHCAPGAPAPTAACEAGSKQLSNNPLLLLLTLYLLLLRSGSNPVQFKCFRGNAFGQLPDCLIPICTFVFFWIDSVIYHIDVALVISSYSIVLGDKFEALVLQM